MTDEQLSRLSTRPSTTELLFEWFQRIVAVYCLIFGVFYWVRLLGFYEGPLWRFDLMPGHWQVASVMLAVLFPFAAIGLWMLASWGPVIWFICAAMETAMYAAFPDLFGTNYPVLAIHGMVAIVYIAFVVFISRRRREKEVSHY
ncbi:MAG: hypothetical protein INR68_12385 [Methylobacterium mesophilicum]|nr:hypothetical protein [Methylobacterium mesophilicum]